MKTLMRWILAVAACWVSGGTLSEDANAQVVSTYGAPSPVVTYMPVRRGLFGWRTDYVPTVSYPVAAAAPVTAYYAPTAVAPTTAYYAPTSAYYAPTTAYYAPTTTTYYPPSTTTFYAPTTTYYSGTAATVVGRPVITAPTRTYYPPVIVP